MQAKCLDSRTTDDLLLLQQQQQQQMLMSMPQANAWFQQQQPVFQYTPNMQSMLQLPFTITTADQLCGQQSQQQQQQQYYAQPQTQNVETKSDSTTTTTSAAAAGNSCTAADSYDSSAAGTYQPATELPNSLPYSQLFAAESFMQQSNANTDNDAYIAKMLDECDKPEQDHPK
jgi:hypothetical protein